MKIISVKFSNLNSLREEVDIDFVDGPLGAAGLFAITGPTGSGKSTILDAISLALYNSTARDQRHEIVSRGSKKAESTVEFELKGKTYRSTWSMKISKPRTEGKSPTGTASMELAIVSQNPEQKEDEIIGDMLRGERSVPALVEGLTGLNFSRFTQSMLLAQGQFDAFLVAPTKDRSDLLEQITGTQIYSDVSKLVYERHKGLAIELKMRKEELEKRGVPDEEQIKKLTEEEIEKTAHLASQQEPIKLLRLVNQAFGELAQVKVQKVQLEKEEQHFAERAELRKSVQEKLAADRRAKPLVADLRSLELQQSELQKVTADLASAEKQLPQLTSQVEQQKAIEASAKIQHTSATENLQKVQITAERLRDLAEVLAKAKKTKQELEDTAFQQRSQQKALLEKEDALKVELQGLADEKVKLNAQFKKLSAYEGVETKLPALRNLQQIFIRDRQVAQQAEKAWKGNNDASQKIELELKTLLEGSPEKLDAKAFGSSDSVQVLESLSLEVKTAENKLNWLKDFGGRLKSHVDDAEQFEQRKNAFTKQKKELNAKGILLEKLRKDVDDHKAILEKLVASEILANEAFQAIKLTAELRDTHLHKLVDGEPCPLCGALEHPALAARSEVKPAKHEEVWSKAKKKVVTQQQIVETANKKAGQVELEIAALTDVNTEKDIADRQEKTDLLVQKLSKELTEKSLSLITINTEGLTKLREVYSTEKLKLNQLQEQFSEVQVLAKAWTVYDQQLSTLKARQVDQNQRAQKAAAERKETAQKLEQSNQAFASAVEALGIQQSETVTDDFVETLQARVDERKHLASSLQLLSTQEAAGKKQAKELLERIEAQEKVVTLSKEALEKQVATLAEKFNLQTELLAGFESVDALLGDANSTFEKSKAALTSASSNLTEINKKIEALKLQQAERRKRIDELTKEISSLSTTLEAAVKTRAFESIEQALASLLVEAEQETLQAEMEAAARVQTSLETRRKSVLEREALLTVKLENQESAEKVAIELKALEQLLATSQEELGGIRKELKRALEDRKAMERDAAEVAKQEDNLADWTTLKDLIGSADGGRFRQYAQRITLQQLIAYANEYLQEFYPRFSVSSGAASNSDPLEIFICDHYEADHVRKVATVSGGERFLVSMALALGFSRMASRNISIDTLFIDEGFGTLDGETLDKAIQALEKLQQRGKTIGIISHVASLQERIGAQIRLVRQSSGRSRVKIVG